MNKKVRNTLITIAIIAITVVAVLIGTNIILKNKIETFTNERLPDNIEAQYEDVSLHLLDGTLTYTNVSVALKNKSNKETHTKVTADKVIVEDLSYWDYLFNKEIHIEDIKLKDPHITYNKNLLVPGTDTTQNNSFIALDKPVLVDELSIDNANVVFFNTNTKDTLLYVPNITVEVDDILVDKSTLKNRMPLQFGDYNAEADSIFLKVSTYENLTVGDFMLKNKKATIQNIQLATKHTRNAYDRMINVERDHFNVTMQQLIVADIDFGFQKRTFFAETSNIEIDQANATIYRNKLVADDPKTKPLYSKMLRDLPIQLTIDSLHIKKSAITYEEKTHQTQPPGTLYFDNLNASVSNVSNTYAEGTKTNAQISSRFMKTAPVQVDWTFDVLNKNDTFTFKGDIGPLPADNMNSFTKPNLLVALEGQVDQTYFSIYGNHNQSNIDLRIKYDHFKVDLLKENGKSEKKLLSGLLNIFVKKDSKNDADGFTKGSATVTPDKTKSFFNYVWLNLRDALKDCLM